MQYITNKFQSQSVQKNWQEGLIAAGSVALSVLLFILVLVNRLPLLRQVGVQARYGFTITVPLILLVYFLLFRIKGRFGWPTGLAVTLVLFAFTLAGLWASGQSEANVISGLLPWSDANSFYLDAQRLMEGGLFNSMSAQRPLQPAFLALILSLSGNNLQVTVAVFTAITALACYLLGREVLRSHGAAAAALVMQVLFLYFRRFTGTVMTESLGVPLGMLGFALLWKGAANRKLPTILGGIFLFTLAFNARPGPFFVFAGLVLWVGWLLRGQRRFGWIPSALVIVTVAAGFLVNMLVFNQVATPESEPFSKASNAIYGVAVGSKHWTQVLKDHPELSSLTNRERTLEIYKLVFEEVRKNPLAFFSGAGREYGLFFGNSSSGMYSTVDSDNLTLRLLTRLGLYALCLLGLFAWLRNRKDPYGTLAAAGFVGILLSVPFAPPSDATRLRMYAAASPVLALLPMLGLAFILEKVGWKPGLKFELQHPDPNLAAGLGGIILVALLTAPLVVHYNSRPSLYTEIKCPAGQQAVYVRYNPGSAIQVIKESVFQLDWMPEFHVGRFRAQVHNSPAFAMVEELDQINAPATLFAALELKTRDEMWLIADTDQLPAPPAVLKACGKWSDNPEVHTWHIFYASSVQSSPAR